MKKQTVFILLLALITFSSGLPPKAIGQQQQKEDDVVVVNTKEVLLDAVVKDKKGRLIKDLQASDFTIYEDDVAQQVQSFRFVSRQSEKQPSSNASASTTNSSSKTASTSTPSSQGVSPANINRLGAIALIFDRLSPDARARARQAALAYVEQGLRPDDFIGVFNVDLSLRVIQSFTNNEQLVRQGIERAASSSSSNFDGRTERISDLSQRQNALQSQGDALQASTAGGGAGAQGAAQAIGSNAVDQAFNEMTLRAEQTFEQLERNQQGYATTDGLLSVITAMNRLPGRKTIIFFSEGMAIPPAVASQFRSVISNANRANVSIYAVDAAGLRAQSTDLSTGQAMTALGQRRASVAASSNDPKGSMMVDLERNEDLLRRNPESGLGELASETGGVLISNTNNLGDRLRQVDDDMNGYYVLTYVPKNQNYDGSFRQISLKVNRSGVDVQARKGYYAIEANYDSPVLAYEAPALAVLSGKQQPNSFASYTAAYNFPETNQPGLVPVVVEIPTGSINFVVNNDKKTYSTDFSVVALIKDSSHRVVKKLSNQYVLSGTLDKLDAAKKGNVLFYREVQLPPGYYTVATVVFDATTKLSSVDVSSITVPDSSSSKLRLSSIVIIKTAEKLSAIDQQKANPFHFGELLLYPNLGEPLRKSVSKDLPLFVTVYPSANNSVPKLKLEIFQNGQAVGQSSYDLPAPDQTGRIQYASAIPLEKFKPGEYELKITVQDSQSSASRTERFRIIQ